MNRSFKFILSNNAVFTIISNKDINTTKTLIVEYLKDGVGIVSATEGLTLTNACVEIYNPNTQHTCLFYVDGESDGSVIQYMQKHIINSSCEIIDVSFEHEYDIFIDHEWTFHTTDYQCFCKFYEAAYSDMDNIHTITITIDGVER